MYIHYIYIYIYIYIYTYIYLYNSKAYIPPERKNIRVGHFCVT